MGEKVSDSHCNMVSMAIGADNRPVVAYKLLDEEESIVVKTFDGTRWQSLGITGSAKGTHPSLATHDGRILLPRAGG